MIETWETQYTGKSAEIACNCWNYPDFDRQRFQVALNSIRFESSERVLGFFRISARLEIFPCPHPLPAEINLSLLTQKKKLQLRLIWEKQIFLLLNICVQSLVFRFVSMFIKVLCQDQAAKKSFFFFFVTIESKMKMQKKDYCYCCFGK